MSTRKITFILAAALSLLVIAGTKVSQLTRTRSLQETSRFLVSTQDATTGRWSSRYITAPDLATNISQWQTNISGSGTVDPTNQVLANIIGTGALTNAGSSNRLMLTADSTRTTNTFNRYYFDTNQAPILSNLVAACVSGDIAELGPGDFRIGVQTIRVPVGVTLRGQGMKRTFIIGDVGVATNAIVQIMSTNTIEDLSIVANKKANYFQYPIGNNMIFGHPAATNATLRRVHLDGETDCLLISQSNRVSITIENCEFRSAWDVCNLIDLDTGDGAPGITATIRDTILYSDSATAQLAASVTDPKSQPLIVSGALVDLITSVVTATNHKAITLSMQGFETNLVYITDTIFRSAGTNGYGKQIDISTDSDVSVSKAIISSHRIQDSDINGAAGVTYAPVQFGSTRVGQLHLTTGLASNSFLYVNAITNVVAGTFGSGLTFSGGTLTASGGSGSTNPVVLAAGFLVNSNLAFQSITNLGTNDVKGWDLFAHRRARMGVFGNTTLVLTNMSSVTNAAGGGLAVPYEADIYVQASGFTFTLASLHPVIGAVHLTGGVTNRMMLDWNGTNWLVRFSDVPTSGNGAYALTNAPTITSATLTLASFSTNTIDSLTDDAPKGRWRLMAHDLDTASLKDIAINQFPGSSMGEVSVLDFGADRTGASDSTVAFQAALTNPAVYIPPGTYILTNVIVTNAAVRGIAGRSIVRFNTNAAPNGYLFDTAANLTHWRGITFDGGCTTNLKTFSTSDEARSGIKLYIGGSATIGDCQFVNWHSNAVYASGINDTTGRPNHFRFFNNTVSNSWNGLWMPAPNLGEYSVVTGNKFLLCYRGLRNDNANVTVTGNTMVDCSYGIYGYDATAGRSHSVYTGNTIHHSGIGFQNALTGINLDGNNMLGSPTIELFAPSFGISFRGNYFENPTFSDYSGGTNFIIGNSVFGSISQSGTSTSVYRNNVGATTGIPISETVALSYTATNIHIRPFRGDTFSVILTNNAGFTIESGGEAQRIKLRLTQDGTGSRTVVFTNTIRFSTTYPTPTLSTGVGKTDWIELQYWSASNRWDVINIGLGN